ncbi:MAG: TilS substrate-binding domain-containing protein [Haliscomenobacter sp.]|nr:TilS substrate-binding domain-containing protein [Haliscomenobacter sp.]
MDSLLQKRQANLVHKWKSRRSKKIPSKAQLVQIWVRLMSCSIRPRAVPTS